MAERWGLERLGFLTLTFSQHVLDPKEAQRRLHSLATHVLNERYAAWLRVFERQKSGRIHYHLLVVVGVDIRTGVDFGAIAQGDYRTSPLALRGEWAFWRRIAKRYGFGRTELLPVRTTSEAAARYVGKYISKHVDARREGDKGVRLVAYSRGAQIARTRFAWAESGQAWRAGVEAFSRAYAANQGLPFAVVKSVGLAKVLGPRWARDWRHVILELGRQALQENEHGAPPAARDPDCQA